MKCDVCNEEQTEYHNKFHKEFVDNHYICYCGIIEYIIKLKKEIKELKEKESKKCLK